MNRTAIKEASTLPCNGRQFRMLLRFLVGVEADTRIRIEEGLSQPLNAGLACKFDEGGRSLIAEVAYAGDILCIDNSNRLMLTGLVRAGIFRHFVPDDRALPLVEGIN